MRYEINIGVHAPSSVREHKQEGDWANDLFDGWFYNCGLRYGTHYRYCRGAIQFANGSHAMMFKLAYGSAR